MKMRNNLLWLVGLVVKSYKMKIAGRILTIKKKRTIAGASNQRYYPWCCLTLQIYKSFIKSKVLLTKI